MLNGPFRISIDISGVPPENTYIGLASFNVYGFNEFEKHFKSNFPSHFRSRWKGSKLHPNELRSIVHCMNDNGVRMGQYPSLLKNGQKALADIRILVKDSSKRK